MEETTPKNLTTVRLWYEHMWSVPDPAFADRVVHPEYDPHWVKIPAKGPEQVKHEIRYLRGMFPDLKYKVVDSSLDADKVWAWYRGSGTHTGSGWGFAATGNSIEFDGMAIFYFNPEGLVINRWAVFSFYDIFTQLGLAPPWWELKGHLKDWPKPAAGDDAV